jgi:hypothetical protein
MRRIDPAAAWGPSCETRRFNPLTLAASGGVPSPNDADKGRWLDVKDADKGRLKDADKGRLKDADNGRPDAWPPWAVMSSRGRVRRRA